MATKIIFNKFIATLIAALIINLIVAFWVLVQQNTLPPQVPLLYGLPQGEYQLTHSIFLLIPPLFAATISIINFLVTRVVKEEFLKIVLLSSTILVTILSSITVIKIIWIL